MLILHYVNNARQFAEGYVRFMLANFPQYEHRFVLFTKGVQPYIFHVDGSFDINTSKKFALVQLNSFAKEDGLLRSWFHESDLILINGLFGSERCLVRYPVSMLKKTYLFLWGGDFYRLNEIENARRLIRRTYKKFVLRNAAGIINLIPGDYDKLCTFVQPKGKRFIAPMSDNGEIRQMLEDLRTVDKAKTPVTIMLGHSGAARGNHLQAMEYLVKFRNEDIRIICPLSYDGKPQYKAQVVEKGRELFGDKFLPLTEYMERREYFSLIAGATVALYNHDRQQAMGNINAALALNTKVFMRNDTSMWAAYKEQGYEVFDIASIPHMTFRQFLESTQAMKKNPEIYLKNNAISDRVKQWEKIFETAEMDYCSPDFSKLFQRAWKNYGHICLYGEGRRARLVYDYAMKRHLAIEAVIVRDSCSLNDPYLEHFQIPVIHLEDVKSKFPEPKNTGIIDAARRLKVEAKNLNQLRREGYRLIYPEFPGRDYTY